MQPYVKIYIKFFDYGETDFIPCEKCGSKAVDIHHIWGRGVGKDVISNLIALCRDCHTKVHLSETPKTDMQYIHNQFLLNNDKL